MSDIAVQLSQEQALVLFDLLARDVLEKHVTEPELRVLWRIEGQLEKVLVAPFAPDYESRLQSAKDTVLREAND